MQMLDSWPSSTTVDGDDAMHGDLSSTWSSVQHCGLEDHAERSPGYVPTPDGMDVRASKGGMDVPASKLPTLCVNTIIAFCVDHAQPNVP